MRRHTKSQLLQLRISPAEKARIAAQARAANKPVSAWVLERLLGESSKKFQELAGLAADRDEQTTALNGLNTLLTGLSGDALLDAVQSEPAARLTPFLSNYVAAMVETACAKSRVPAPHWTTHVARLDDPYFASSLQSLRLHLLVSSPPAFRQRNIFIDSSLGDTC